MVVEAIVSSNLTSHIKLYSSSIKSEHDYWQIKQVKCYQNHYN